MKSFLLTILLATSFSFTSTAQASDIAGSVCEYVSADDKKRLRNFLKSNKIKIRNIYDGVMCNGSSLLTFASASNSIKTGKFIIKKLPKDMVATSIPSISSPELLAIAQKRAG